MSEVARILTALGVIPEDCIAEQERWNRSIPLVEGSTEELKKLGDLHPDQLRAELDKALDHYGYAVVRTADLDAHTVFERSAQETKLVHTGKKSAKVLCAKHGTRFLLKVAGEDRDVVDSLLYVLTDGQSHIEWDGKKIFFGEGSSIIYNGEVPSFLSLKPSTMES